MKLYVRSAAAFGLSVVAYVAIKAAEHIGRAQEVDESALDYHLACCALAQTAADAREAEGFVEEDLEQWEAELVWGEAP